MSILQIMHMAAIAIAFIVWSFFMFSMLFSLSRRSVAKNAETGGGYFSWVGHSLQSFGNAATSDEDRPMRRRILWATLVLMGLIALTPIVAQLGR